MTYEQHSNKNKFKIYDSTDCHDCSYDRCNLCMILGTAVCYALGTAWLAIQAHMGLSAALMAGVIPFLPGDFIKMILALLIAPQIRKQLDAAGLAR